jgi:hypothetical protein
LAAVLIIVVSCGERSNGAGDGRFALKKFPDGAKICMVLDATDADTDQFFAEPGPLAVWGDSSSADPWTGLLAHASVTKTDEVPVHDDVRPVTVRGKAGYVGAAQLFQGVSSRDWGYVITWMETPGTVVEIGVRGGDESDALRIAEAAIVDNTTVSFPKDALGANTEIIVQGIPIDPLGIGGRAIATVHFSATPESMMQVRTFRNDITALALTRYLAVASEERTVRNRRALLYAVFDSERGPWGVLWQETAGIVIQVSGFTTKDEALNAAGMTRRMNPTQWQRLKDEETDCFAAEAPSSTR